MMRVAVHPWYPALLANGAFDPAHEMNTNHGLDRWVVARERLLESGIRLDTYDTFDHRHEADAWLIHEPGFEQMRFLVKNRVPIRKTVLVMIEPWVIHPFPWRWYGVYRRLFPAILNWHSHPRYQGPNVVPYRFPVEVDPDALGRRGPGSRDNVFVLMRANKASGQPGEHYFFRRQLIQHFDARGDGLLDLYGSGWNDPDATNPLFTTLHRGRAPDKVATYARHEFAFCFDNSTEPGYVTQDALTAMAAGTVPIYWPPDDIDNHMPRGTYIDIRRFDGIRDVVAHALSIRGGEEYDRLLERAGRFLRSEHYWRFTNEAFYASVHHALKRVGAPGRPPPLPRPLGPGDHDMYRTLEAAC